MITAITVILAVITVMAIGGFIGYCNGYDKAWDEAILCAEEEVKNAVLQSKN